MSLLIEIVQKANHSREQRDSLSSLFVAHPEKVPDLLSLCECVDEEISYRASWVLEFVSNKNLHIILPHLDRLLQLFPKVNQHQAVRPMSKICEYLTTAHFKKKTICLSLLQQEKIAECCFDWLITEQKVAAKAYSMTSLYLLGKSFEWIHPELKTTLENNFQKGSAAYKARARRVLDKLK